MEDFHPFSTPVRKRLNMIKKNWKHFTAFYFVNGAPATNNPIENYYSTSLKTHRKKQLREKGIKNQINAALMKDLAQICATDRTLLEAFLGFLPFLTPG